MQRVVVVAALLALVPLACAATVSHTVRMVVFSGTPDPEVVITPNSEFASLLPMIMSSAQRPGRTPYPWFSMGYRGFVVSAKVEGRMQSVQIYDDASVELQMLAMFRDLPQQVVAHVRSRVFALSDPRSVLRVQALTAAPRPTHKADLRSNDDNCTVPVRGPDHGTVYDPNTDDCGLFVTDQYENNCYDYGTNIVTDTFAQPGRGSGAKWTVNTCDDMRRAATSDGLVWAGTDLPKGQASNGHYVALLIWPDTNFHWIRMDDNAYWSHKPGGTEVRNVDNEGNTITDPSKSDFSPWTQFCGYMIAVPSTLNIN